MVETSMNICHYRMSDLEKVSVLAEVLGAQLTFSPPCQGAKTMKTYV